MVDLAKKACPRPWMAVETEAGLKFIKGITDYSASNGDGTKGVVVRFFCDIGMTYLVCIPSRYGGKKIIKAKVNANGTLQKIIRN